MFGCNYKAEIGNLLICLSVTSQAEFPYDATMHSSQVACNFRRTDIVTAYRNNHYVPVWYQEQFIPQGMEKKNFGTLTSEPETVVSNSHPYMRNALLRWGPKKCFCQDDLYTTKYGQWLSTEIEEKFFCAQSMRLARPALDYFSDLSHPSAEGDLFHRFLLYMSIQKLRTPKGLAYLSNLTRQELKKNRILFELQRLQQIFCAIWTECVWSIADASSLRPSSYFQTTLSPSTTRMFPFISMV